MPKVWVTEIGKSIDFPDDMSMKEIEEEITKYLDGIETSKPQEDPDKTSGGFARGARALGSELVGGARNFLSTAASPLSPTGLITPSSKEFDALTALKNKIAPVGEASTTGERVGEGIGKFAGAVASDAPYFAASTVMGPAGPGLGFAAATAARDRGQFSEDMLTGEEQKTPEQILRDIAASGVEGAMFGPASKWASKAPSLLGRVAREGVAGAGIMGTGAAVMGDSVAQGAAAGLLLGGGLGMLTKGAAPAAQKTAKQVIKDAGYTGKQAEEKLVADALGIPGVKPPAFPQNLNLDNEETMNFVLREFEQGKLPYVEKMSFKDIFEHGRKNGTLDEQRALVINNAKKFEETYGTFKSRGLASEETAAMDIFRKTVAETQDVKRQLNIAMESGSRQEIESLQSRYNQLKGESSALLAIDMGYGTEAATAMSARNMFRRGEPLTERALRILEKRGELDGEMMDRVMDAQGIDEMRALVSAGWNPTWGEKFHEAWIMGMLSNPLTFGPLGVNTISNAAKDIFLRIPVKFGTASIEGAMGLMGKERQYTFGDLKDEIAVDMAESLPLLRQWRRDILRDKPLAGTKLELDSGPAIGGKLGAAIRTPGRWLEATDSFFRSKAEAREALKIASEKMGRKASWEDRRNLSKRIIDNPDEFREEIKRIRRAGDEAVFTTSLRQQSKEGVAIAHAASTLQNLKNSKNPAVGITAKAIFPFVRTPANIAIDALKHSPLGIIELARLANTGASRRELSEQAAKIAVGSTMMSYIWSQTAAGNVTGGGPVDYADYQKWLKAGNQPYSFKIGDTWTSYQRIEPFASIFGAAADAVEVANTAGDERFGRAMAAIKDNIANKTFLLGLENLSRAWADPKRYGAQFAKGMATSLVPSFLGAYARVSDPVQRITSGDTMGESLVNSIKNRVPGLKQTLEPRYGVTGTPVIDKNNRINAVTPFRITDAGDASIVDIELNRLAGLGQKVPNMQQRKRNIPGEPRPVSASREEYAIFHQYNKQAADVMEKIMSTPSWSKMSPEAQSDIVMSIFNKYNRVSSSAVRSKMYQDRN